MRKVKAVCERCDGEVDFKISLLMGGVEDYAITVPRVCPHCMQPAIDKLVVDKLALMAALERLLGANESDAERRPAMDVLTAFGTNRRVISQAREAIAKAEAR
jgi:hypothetical protein